MKKAARKASRIGTPLTLDALALATGGDVEVHVRKAEIDGDFEGNRLKSERVQ